MASSFILPDDFLQSLGINLDPASQELFTEHFKSTLMDRVLFAATEMLSDSQLDELEKLHGKEDGILLWLEKNVPDFKDIVSDEIDILIGEIVEDSEKSKSA